MKQFLLSFTLLFTTVACWCQAGKVDRTFGNNGAVNTHFTKNAFLNAIAIQPDQKIVAAGFAGDSIALTRYNTDGSLDNSFGVNGKVLTYPGNTAIAMSVTIQTDRKILAAGYNEFLVGTNQEEDLILIRYKTNGTIDSSFGSNGIVAANNDLEDFALAVATQPDGKIIVAGGTDNYGPGNVLVQRYNINGFLDNTFGNNGTVITGYDNGVSSYDVANRIALQADGKIIISGVSEDDLPGFPLHNILIRYNSNGSLDNSFGNGGKAPFLAIGTWAHSLNLQQDGKILTAGFAYDKNYDNEGVIGRYNVNGTIDNTYGNNGLIYLKGIEHSYASTILSAVIQADGKAIFGGVKNNTDLFFARYNTIGVLDSTYGKNGITDYVNPGLSAYEGDLVCELAKQSDGKIIAGSVCNHSFSLGRLLGDAGSIKYNPNYLSMRAYPNPATSNLFIDGLDKTLPAVITISDVAGNIMKVQKLVAGTTSVNVATLQHGRYVAVFTQNNKTGSVQFIKQ